MQFAIKTKKRDEVVDITEQVADAVAKSKVKEGVCLVYVPHATSALTINENADPNIGIDFMDALDKLISQGIWRHDRIDQNGAAHIKAAVIGPDVMIPIKNSTLSLGAWQGIMLCEFDGPRDRRVVVTIIKTK